MNKTLQDNILPLRTSPYRFGLQLSQVTSSREWQAFHALPARIYRDDKNWVPPLQREQKRMFRPSNPFFRKALFCAWLVLDGTTAVGRIVAYIDNAYNSFHGQKTGFFGFFECESDKEAAFLLLRAAQDWLTEKGMEKIRGPINFDIGNECGVLIKGDAYPPYLQMAHTPIYYRQLLEEASFQKAHDLLAFRIDLQILSKDKVFLEKLAGMAKRAERVQAWQICSLSQRNFSQEVERVRYAYNHWLTENWGFSPVSKEELRFSVASLKSIVIPELVLFVKKGKELIGCCVTLPDVNQVLHKLRGKLFPFGIFRFLYLKRKISRARLILLAVSPAHRNRSLDIYLYYLSIIRVIDLGFKEAELSWISEDNKVMLSIVRKFGAELYKQYRVFEKIL